MTLTKSRNRMTAGAPINILDYGAALNGTTDDTAAWNAALATGRDIVFPEGTSKITGKLSFSATEGQAIIGAGRYKSQFSISYVSFNMVAAAVLQLGAAHQSIQRLGIVFAQPSTAVRASVKQYPNAIDLQGYSRAVLQEILIQGAWLGIGGQGNCGGAIIDDIQCGAISQGLVLDGALDSIRISRFHHWPFGFVTDVPLMTVWQDNATIGLDIGRVDDFHITDLLVFSARVRFVDHGSGAPTGHVTNLALDSKYSTLEMSAGKVTVANLNAGTNVDGHAIIILSGGELKISGLAMECGTEHLPMVSISAGTFICTGIMVTSYGVASKVFFQTGGKMFLSNGHIETVASNRSSAMIQIGGGRAVVTGMRSSDAGVATGDFINVGTDDYHVIANNQSLGWSITVPANKAAGVYEPNGTVDGGMQGSWLLGPTHHIRFTGTLDGAGAATIAHGLTNPHLKVVSLTAFYTSAAPAQVAFTPTSIDATTIVLAAGGGGASKDYTCWLCMR